MLTPATAIAAGTPIHHDRSKCRLAKRTPRAIAYPSSYTSNVHPGSLLTSVLCLIFSALLLLAARRALGDHVKILGKPSL